MLSVAVSITWVVPTQGKSKPGLCFCVQSAIALLIIILEIHLLSRLILARLLLLCYQS